MKRKTNAYYERKKRENYREFQRFSKEALYAIQEEEEAKLYFYENINSGIKVIGIIAFIAGVICDVMEESISIALIMECIPYISLFTVCLCVISFSISVLCAYFVTKTQMRLKRIEREITKRGG